MRARLALMLTSVLAAGCGGHSAPTEPTPAPVVARPNITISGTVSNTVSGGALNATVNTGNAQLASSGTFSMTFAPGFGTIPFAVEGPGVFPHQVWVDASRTHTISLDAVAVGGGFDETVYKQLVRDAYEGKSEPLRRWTAAPSIYLMTVDEDGAAISQPQLDLVEATIRDAVPQWTDGKFSVATIERGSATRPAQSGWLPVIWSSKNPADLGGCGTSNVGGGTITLAHNGIGGLNCSCNGLLRPRTVRHEVGHAMGFWHTDSTNDVMSGPAAFGCDQALSAREKFHVKIAYSRPVGNIEPDSDPRGTVNLAPSRIVP
jgi:hypothetical protein